MGGVLLIDEAYTLYADSERDYGHEVVAELIKKMEDYRDKLVVIMAGYTYEMERFLGMNPGLKDRVQFKIEFPDYNPEDLLEIFKKFCRDKDYTIDEMGEAELLKIFTQIHSTRDSNFANARTVRKCFERIKLAQAGRIMRSTNRELENLRGILREDIAKLYEDEDVRRMTRREVKERRSIGFIG
jgi:SpoVK/Ycf46/Vps4 family AAA+-type ATPase